MSVNCPELLTAEVKTKKYQIAGNINETRDMFAVNEELPIVNEGFSYLPIFRFPFDCLFVILGDLLAFYPGGAYASAMLTNHCMRGQDLKEVLVP